MTFPNIQIKKDGAIEKHTHTDDDSRKKANSYARGHDANRTTYSRNVYSTHSTKTTVSETDDFSGASILNRDAKMKVYGIPSETPWVSLSDDLSFSGEWKELLGTELIINNDGECLGKIKYHLDLQHGILSENEKNSEGSRIQKLRRGEALYEKALLLATEYELDRKKSEKKSKKKS